MPSYEQTNAAADAEMEAFLAGMNQPASTEQQTPAVPATPDVKEEDYYDDEDDVGQEGTGAAPAAQTQTYTQQTTQSSQPPAPTMYTPEQLEYERRLAEERGRNAAYNDIYGRGIAPQQQQVQPPQPQQQSYFSADELEFTEDELKNFSQDTTAYAAKIANRAVNRILNDVVAPLQQEVLAQREQLANYGAGVATTNAKVLYSQVQAVVPDLPQIVESPEWKAYMNSPNPLDSTSRVGDTFLSHLHRGNTKDILNIIQMFKKNNPGNAVQAQLSPGQSSVGQPPTTIPKREPKKLSYSKYLEALEKWQAGKMTYDEYAKVEKMFDNALMEGRVKY